MEMPPNLGCFEDQWKAQNWILKPTDLCTQGEHINDTNKVYFTLWLLHYTTTGATIHTAAFRNGALL